MGLTEQQIARLMKEDARYFIERFFYIVDKERNKVPFLLNTAQSKYWTERTNADIILKSRKEGFSSLIEAAFLHACIFYKNL